MEIYLYFLYCIEHNNRATKIYMERENMNNEARKHMDHVINSLNEAKSCLQKASSNAENGAIREKIDEQMGSIENCLKECEGITSGLSNF